MNSRERLQTTLQDTIENLLLQKGRQRVKEFGRLLYWSPRTIEGIRMHETTAYERVEDVPKAEGWKNTKVGDGWGGNGKFAWFHLQFVVPDDLAGKTLVAILRLGGEGCVFIGGSPYQGIDRNHPEVILADRAEPGERFDLMVECVPSQLTVECVSNHMWKNQPNRLEQADLAALNHDAKNYWHDLGLILDIAEALPQGSRRRATIVRTANKSVDAFDTEAQSFEELSKVARKAAGFLAPLYKLPAEASALRFACVGHSHIDVAWLWPYAETIRKCSRTFSTVDRLMGEYPFYLFIQSQAQLFEFTKEHYPALYDRIKARVKEGRLEPEGSMWVEADCNICSGESLVRQIFLGKTYFMDEFGVETNILWLPDVFGYSAALPQILVKSGVRCFMTIKIACCSQFNRFPYSSFWWEGIDGTRVLSHFPPSNDYNCRMDPVQLRASAESYTEKDRSDIVLYPYGWGDGGGGPDRTHLERLKRAGDLEGIPKCAPMRAGDFFSRFETCSEDLPTWVGELYLEYHRGTYTTQARCKLANRRSEFLLRDAEMVSALAWALLRVEYPSAEFDRAWKLLCKNQFHDVLPGSSVAEVYQDAAADHKEIAKIGESARAVALGKIVGEAAESGNLTIFNSLSWDRSEAVKVEVLGSAADWQVRTLDGQVLPSQVSADSPSSLWVETQGVPGIGLDVMKLVRGAPGPQPSTISVSSDSLENRFYRIALDANGLISSIYDKRANREVLPNGAKANELQLFEDKPVEIVEGWDAWDIDFYYRDKGRNISELTEILVEESGPARGSIRIRRNFGDSEIDQRIVLWASSPRIDFETRVDWHETKKLLKAAFPVDVHTNSARFEIQFGSVDRPNHWNTSWDFARFEVPAQKWADLSQADYGVSLLNDCKYGYDVIGNVLRLTLLRSPKSPDPNADMGEHRFTYSLLPHQGDWRAGETVRRAYELNVPLVPWMSEGISGMARQRFLGVDVPNVIIETVKKADLDNGVIVRMYESAGESVRVRLARGIPVSQVTECDLLERDICSLAFDQDSVVLDMKPFEIKTLKLTSNL